MHRARARVLPILTLVVACGLGACGSEPVTPGRSVKGDAPASVLVLDPAGRLLASQEEPEFLLCQAGRATSLPAGWDPFDGDGMSSLLALDTLPEPDTQLHVLVDGCVPVRVKLKAGRAVVPLTRGFRVRLELVGPATKLAKGVRFGVTLKKPFHCSECGVEDARVRPVAAESIDEDRPHHPQYIRIRWPERRFIDLYVPEAGAYELGWVVRGGNWSMGMARREPLLLEPGAAVVELPFPAEWIREAKERGGR